MKAVWKLPLPELSDLVGVPMPQGARVLCVQVQNGAPCVWALVDTEAPVQDRLFRVAGTGHRLDDAACQRYIGSFQLDGGRLVFHLFDLG